MARKLVHTTSVRSTRLNNNVWCTIVYDEQTRDFEIKPFINGVKHPLFAIKYTGDREEALAIAYRMVVDMSNGD